MVPVLAGQGSGLGGPRAALHATATVAALTPGGPFRALPHPTYGPPRACLCRWVFSSEGVTALGDESLAGAAWEILYNAVNKTIARVQVGRRTRRDACALLCARTRRCMERPLLAGLPATCTTRTHAIPNAA